MITILATVGAFYIVGKKFFKMVQLQNVQEKYQFEKFRTHPNIEFANYP